MIETFIVSLSSHLVLSMQFLFFKFSNIFVTIYFLIYMVS